MYIQDLTLSKLQELICHKTQPSRPGEGWAPPGYSCPRHATRVAFSQTNQVTGQVKMIFFFSFEVWKT